MSFGDMLEQSFKREEMREGEIVHGHVVAIQKDHAIVDIGFKAEGVVNLSEFPVIDGKLSMIVS